MNWKIAHAKNACSESDRYCYTIVRQKNQGKTVYCDTLFEVYYDL